MIGGLFYTFFFPLWTFLICVIGLPLTLSKKATTKYAKFWAESSLFWLKIFCGLKIKYLGKIPPKSSIVASQHQSVLEIIALIAILEEPIFILKQSLMRIPILGLYLKQLEMIGVNRKNAGKLWITKAHEKFKKGKTIVIFPEGTRVNFGQEIPYKGGIFKVAKELEQNIYPAATNTGLFWARRSWFKKKGTATIAFGDPIPPEPELLRQKYKELL